MFVSFIIQTNPKNKRFKSHFIANNTLEGRQFHRKKVYPLWENPPKHIFKLIINKIKCFYLKIHKSMINNVHYLSGNNNRINVHNTLVYIKWTSQCQCQCSWHKKPETPQIVQYRWTLPRMQEFTVYMELCSKEWVATWLRLSINMYII